MLLKFHKRKQPILGESYAYISDALTYLFDDLEIDYTTALSLFFIGYEASDVDWNAVPFRYSVRDKTTATILKNIATELELLFNNLESLEIYQKCISGLYKKGDIERRTSIAQAITRALIVLNVCAKYIDYIDYHKVQDYLLRKDYLYGVHAYENKATMALILICSFLKHRDILVHYEDSSSSFSYRFKTPFQIFNLLVDDLNLVKNPRDWFFQNTSKSLVKIIKEAKIEILSLQLSKGEI